MKKDKIYKYTKEWHVIRVEIMVQILGDETVSYRTLKQTLTNRGKQYCSNGQNLFYPHCCLAKVVSLA